MHRPNPMTPLHCVRVSFTRVSFAWLLSCRKKTLKIWILKMHKPKFSSQLTADALKLNIPTWPYTTFKLTRLKMNIPLLNVDTLRIIHCMWWSCINWPETGYSAIFAATLAFIWNRVHLMNVCPIVILLLAPTLVSTNFRERYQALKLLSSPANH